MPSCPKCKVRSPDGGGPYRMANAEPQRIPLEPHPHPSGVTVLVCRSCRGALAAYDALVEVESFGRAKNDRATAAAIVQRAYAAPTEPISCARCGGETTRRQWGIATLVFVDICLDFDCRNVWLDAGELEAIGSAGRL